MIDILPRKYRTQDFFPNNVFIDFNININAYIIANNTNIINNNTIKLKGRQFQWYINIMM